MAKLKSTSTPPSQLRMELFAPGMSLLHRAGLGGLACTLSAWEDDYRAGRLSEDRLPGPCDNGEMPWSIEPEAVTLNFGQPQKARLYLQRLFEYAFQIKDGLIFMPGQFDTPPAFPIRAELQSALTLTLLQHNKSRDLQKDEKKTHYHPEHDGIDGVSVQYKECQWFKHQSKWEELIDQDDCQQMDKLEVDGSISPGAVVRHQAFPGTKATEPPERYLPLLFALVGTMALPINRGTGVLIVPDVTDLIAFMVTRRAMSPRSVRDCQVGGGADGGFQALLRARDSPIREAQTRLRAARTAFHLGITGCFVMTFRSTPWSTQQKSRVATVFVRADDQRALDRFERAMKHLPLQIRVPKVMSTPAESLPAKPRRGRAKQTPVTPPEEYRADSLVRPFVAENLARGRKWYAGFVDLMVKTNPANKKPFRDQISFERKGLHDMIADTKMWDEIGEQLVVKAVHEAIRQSLGRIKDETDGDSGEPSQATKNRWERFRERLRLDLAGAKTEAHVRFALMDLFSRGGNNSVLRENWHTVLPVIRKNWQLARDLGLLALASYSSRDDGDSDRRESSEMR
jgi:CRISPR-associated protein Cas8a1/Csx13